MIAKRTIIFAIIVIGILCAGAVWYATPKHEAPAKPWNCSTGQSPCIELLNSKGIEIAKFNDFGFLPNHCITYEQGSWKTYCGQYQLKWIGPNSQKKTLSV